MAENLTILISLVSLPLALLVTLPLMLQNNRQFLRAKAPSPQRRPDWRDVYPHLSGRK